jgi:type II secretory pathway component PulL
MILVDDLLITPFLSILDIVQTMALNELYDLEQLQDDRKENQLLFEIGERDRETYERRKAELEAQIEAARRVRSQVQGRFEIKR